MCRQCWQDYGAPQIWSRAVSAAASLIDAVYEHHSAGGGLHTVLDDWNINDEDLAHGRFTEDDDEREPEGIAAEEACLAALRALTVQERASALALRRGFWGGRIEVHTTDATRSLRLPPGRVIPLNEAGPTEL